MRAIDCVHEAHDDMHFTAETDEDSWRRYDSIATSFTAR
jgi:hypothetical protein